MIRGRSGRAWEVTRRGYAKVLSLSQGSVEQNALQDHRTWSAAVSETPTGAGDYFFYLRNDSEQYNLIINYVWVFDQTADIVGLAEVTGTPSGGTTVTPQNRTLGSSKQPADFVMESGVDITGLTSLGTLQFFVLDATHPDIDNMADHPIVIPQGAAIGLFAVTGTTDISAFVHVWEDLTDPQVVNNGSR